MSIAEMQAQIPKLTLAEIRELERSLREAREDAEDVAAADAAMAEIEAGAPTVKWEDLKRELEL